jgi:hypothetical protein
MSAFLSAHAKETNMKRMLLLAFTLWVLEGYDAYIVTYIVMNWNARW